VNYPPISNDESGSFGSVYVWERKPSGWKLRRLMKPSVAPEGHSGYGNNVALDANGKNLIVGEAWNSSGALGINGDPSDTSAPNTGAVWSY